MDKTEIVDALRTAADQVELHGPHAIYGAPIGVAAGIPGWLLTILQLVGPAVLQAIKAWLETVVPTPPTPGK